MLTQAELKSLLHYNQETGIFTWLKHNSGVSILKAGTNKGNGYIQISLKRKRYLAHRLAWLYVYGEWPKQQIDHINGIRDDNRIVNLRDVSRSKNLLNQNHSNINKRNKSGVVGVSYFPRDNNWVAQFMVNGVTKYLGRYATVEEAKKVLFDAKEALNAD